MQERSVKKKKKNNKTNNSSMLNINSPNLNKIICTNSS